MSFYSKVGNFIIDTSKTVGQTQSISGLGFQPKIVLFFWTGTTSTSDTIVGQTLRGGFGAANGTTHFSSTFVSVDGATDSDSASLQYTTRLITIRSDGATTDGYYNACSMDSDGFTLTVGDQYSLAQRITYVALGGTDITNTYIGNVTTTGTTGNYDITGVGFQPDVCLIGGYASSINNTSTNNAYFFLGWATGSSEQGVISLYSVDAAVTSNTSGYGYNGEVISSRIGGERDAFVSFLADGVRLNHIAGSSARVVYLVCIKGGQYHVGEFTTRTDTNNISETGVGFQPSVVIFGSANRAVSTQGTYSDHARMSIGAATSSAQEVQSLSDEDNLADTECAVGVNDGYVYQHIKDDAQEAAAAWSSMDSDGFTLTQSDAETSACWVTYLAMAGVAGTAASSNRSAYTKGRQDSSSNRSAYTKGSSSSSSNRAVYTRGALGASSNRAVYTSGQSAAQQASSNRPVYTHGVSTASSSRSVYTKGKMDTPVAFGSFPLLDDFQRSSLGSRYTNSNNPTIYNDSEWSASTTGTTWSYWNVQTFGPAIEVYATITNLGGIAPVYLDWAHNTTTGYKYFLYIYDITQTGARITIYKDNGANVELYNKGSNDTWTSRDSVRVGVRHISNGDIQLWLDRGSGWELLTTINDSEVQSAGYFRLRTYHATSTPTHRWDNLGGGTLHDFHRSVYTKGRVDTSSSRAVYTVGFTPGTPASSNRAAYTKGKLDTSSNRSVYTKGSIDSTSNRSVYTRGRADSSSHQAVFVSGRSSASSNMPVYLDGEYGFAIQWAVLSVPTVGGGTSTSSNRAAYTKGKDSASGNRAVFTRGRLSTSSNRAVYTSGTGVVVSSNQPVYVRGRQSTSDNRSVYTSGVATAESHRAVFVAGGLPSSSNRAAYTKGVASTSDHRAVYTMGGSFTSSNRAAYTRGREFASSHQAVYLFSGTTASSHRAAYVTARVYVQSHRAIWVFGYEPSGINRIAFTNSNSSLSKYFRILTEGYDDGTWTRQETNVRTIEGKLDRTFSPVYNTWSMVIRVRHTESDTGYGTLADLQTFFGYINPNGTPSNVITFTDHHSGVHQVHMVGPMNKGLIGVQIEGSNAWYLYRVVLQEV